MIYSYFLIESGYSPIGLQDVKHVVLLRYLPDGHETQLLGLAAKQVAQDVSQGAQMLFITSGNVPSEHVLPHYLLLYNNDPEQLLQSLSVGPS